MRTKERVTILFNAVVSAVLLTCWLCLPSTPRSSAAPSAIRAVPLAVKVSRPPPAPSPRLPDQQPRAQTDWTTAIAAARDARLRAESTRSPQRSVRAFIERTALLARYDYLLRSLDGLSRSAREQVLALLEKRVGCEHDAKRAAEMLGIKDWGLIFAMIQRQQAGIDQQLALACGSDGAKAFNLLQLDGAMQLITASVQPNLTYDGAPLTLEQQIALARIFRQYHFSKTDSEGYAMLARPSDATGGIAMQAAFVEQDARGLLSAEQSRGLREFVQELQAHAARGQRVPSH